MGRPSATSASRRSSSSNESATMRPTPSSSAARSSASDLLLPWNTTRAAGNPARTATWSSPPVATSRWRPSSATRRAIAMHRNALPAYDTASAPNASRYSRARARSSLLVVHVERRAERRRERIDVAPADLGGARRRRRRRCAGRAADRSARPAPASSASGRLVVVEARHLVGRVHTEDRQRVGQARPGTPRPARGAPA